MDEVVATAPAEKSLEERRFEFEVSKHTDEMALARESRVAELDSKRKSQWSSPLVITVIGGIVALLGNALVALDNLQQAKAKAADDLKVEMVRDDANLIIEAIKTGDNFKAEQNLQLLAKARLLNDPAKQIAILRLLREGIRPSLPAGNTSAVPGAPSVHVPIALSGKDWVGLFPESTKTEDLIQPFRNSVENFLKALSDGGAAVQILGSSRPPQRAYLMHWAYMVAKGEVDPSAVPPMNGVNIIWAHLDKNGRLDIPASRKAAQEMVDGWGVTGAAALVSRHTQRRAVDMNVAWVGVLPIKDKNGKVVTITSLPRSGLNTELIAVGATYGVHKLVYDPPHWSDDGH